MRAAVYLRVSSDRQDVRNSVARQLTACRTWAAANAAEISDAHVYRDEAISGATMLARPGLQSLLRDLGTKGTPPFAVVLVDDDSRLDRGGNLAELVRRFAARGVRLVAVDSGRDLTNEDEELLVHVKSGLNAHYSREIARRTRNGLAQRVLRGYHAGGKIYGYRLVPEWPEGLRPEQRDGSNRLGTRVEIDPEQAAIVREMFARHAAGDGFAAIAGDLNRRAVPSPRGGVWDASAIRAILTNGKYSGDWTWNVSRWRKKPESALTEIERARVVRTGRYPRQRSERPDADRIASTREDLRIVERSTWSAVADLFAQREGGMVRAPSRSPLAGLMKCSCGGPIIRHGGSNASGHRLACGWATRRGGSVCDQRRSVREDAILAAVVDHLSTVILRPDVITKAQKARAQKARQVQKRATPAALAEARARVTRLEDELRRLTDAIAAGADPVAVAAGMAERRIRLDAARRVLGELSMAGLPIPMAPPAPDTIARDLAALRGEGPKLREILRRVVAEVKIQPAASGWELDIRTRPWAAGSSPEAGSGGLLPAWGEDRRSVRMAGRPGRRAVPGAS